MRVLSDSARTLAPQPGRREGFTLVELLVVIGLIAGLTALWFGNLRGGADSAALKSSQAAVAGLLTVARTKAVSSGRGSRVLLNIDATSSAEMPRFLRYFLVQTHVSGAWETVMDLYLPDGTYVVPGDFSPLPDGLFAEGADAWLRVNGVTKLRSTVLRSTQIVSETIYSDVAQQWASISISPAGTTSQSGDLVIASGRPRTPTSFAEGESPVELVNPASTCGLALSAYGLTVLINDRASF